MDPTTADDGGILVRRRRDSDIARAARGLVRVHAEDGYPVEGVSQPEAWLTPPRMQQAWIAEIAGAIVGHVAISSSSGEAAVALWLAASHDQEHQVAVLARLFVIPEARKRAVGERLVCAAVQYAQEHGVRLVLDVLAKDAAAIRLYTRLGWTQVGAALHRYGDGQVSEALCYVAPLAS